jgi:acetyltransferase-like isoleucine patch superfamily enzyme
MKINPIKNYKSHGSGYFSLSDFKHAGENIILEKGVLVFHPENITVESNVYVGHNAILKGYYKNEMIIGEHTWIGQNCFFHSAGGIKIGKAVGIGPYVKILTSAHKDDNTDIPILFHDIELKEVIIEDSADIGVGSIILPGVTIGEGSVIGAGSVVTKDIPPFSVAVGNPCKVIRDR